MHPWDLIVDDIRVPATDPCFVISLDQKNPRNEFILIVRVSFDITSNQRLLDDRIGDRRQRGFDLQCECL